MGTKFVSRGKSEVSTTLAISNAGRDCYEGVYSLGFLYRGLTSEESADAPFKFHVKRQTEPGVLNFGNESLAPSRSVALGDYFNHASDHIT